MSEIKKEMNILELMSVFPGSITVLRAHGIGSLKVLENLEKNILDAGKNVQEILDVLEKEFEESKKPVQIDIKKLLDVSEEAVEEFKKLLLEKKKKGWAFRVLVHSPSPNKYSYGMEIEKNPAKGDIIVKKHGLKFFVAKKHAKEIEGTKIEFDQKERGFKFYKTRRVSLIIFYTKDKKILLQNRPGISKAGEEWGFFGGKIEKDETPEEAVIRETKEELDFDLKEHKFIGEFSNKKGDLFIDRFVFICALEDIKNFQQKEGTQMELFNLDESKKLKMVSGDDVVLQKLSEIL